MAPLTDGQLCLFPDLFPLIDRATTPAEFLDNLTLLRDWHRDGTFTIEAPLAARSDWIDLALKQGAGLSLLPTLADLQYLNELLEMKCQVCGEPSDCGIKCSCGTYAWCKEHLYLDEDVVIDHTDHDCSSECCERGHKPEEKTVAEIEAMIIPIYISMSEEETEGENFRFTVEVRQKSDEKRIREFEWLLGEHHVAELDNVTVDTWFFDAPLAIGEETLIKPTGESSPLLALAVARYIPKPLRVQVVARHNEWEYLCLLPKGIEIPGLSQPYQATEVHCLVLNRSELHDP